MIFTTLHKWSGKDNVLLTVSQIKQIGGRAGRFGTFTDDPDTAGTVTTLHSDDLPLLKLAMESPLPALPAAYIAPNVFVLETLYTTLPPQTGLETLYRLLSELTAVREPYKLSDLAELLVPASMIDEHCPNLPIRVRALLSQVPMDWRDYELTQAFQSMLKGLVDGLVCDPTVLAGHFLGVLKEVESHQAEYNTNKEAAAARIAGRQAVGGLVPQGAPGKQAHPLSPLPITDTEASTPFDPPSMHLQTANSLLIKLEVLHKLLVAYAWLSYRFPITFGMKETADDLKHRTETAIEFCLECIRTIQKKAQRGRTKQMQGIPMKGWPPSPKSQFGVDQPSL